MEFFAKEIQTAQALFVVGWPCRALVRETKRRVGTRRHRILHSSPVDEEKKHSYDPPYRPFGVALLAKNPVPYVRRVYLPQRERGRRGCHHIKLLAETLPRARVSPRV